MKGFYITVFGVLLAISIIRFTYGTSPLTVSQLMVVIEDFPLDVKEDFNGVIYELTRVRSAISTFESTFKTINFSSASSLWDKIKGVVLALGSIFNIIRAICSLFIAFLKFLLLVIKDFIVLLTRVFSLFFGVSSDFFNTVPGTSSNGGSAPGLSGGGDSFGDFGGGGFGGGGGGGR